MNKGLTHIYKGGGKGKTTAAIGLCIRFIGTGQKAIFAQFLKGQESSERTVLRSQGVKVVNPLQPTKFVRDMNEAELLFCKQAQKNCLSEIKVLVASGEYSLLILDEVLDAIELDLIDEKDIIELINTNKNRVIVPIESVNRASIRALRYAQTISDNVVAFCVVIDGDAAAEVEVKLSQTAEPLLMVTLLLEYIKISLLQCTLIPMKAMQLLAAWKVA